MFLYLYIELFFQRRSIQFKNGHDHAALLLNDIFKFLLAIALGHRDLEHASLDSRRDVKLSCS